MKKFLILLFLISLNLCDELYENEGDLLVLNEETFGRAIREYKYILVLFYTSSCEVCEQFHPEYKSAASILIKENLFLAKLDCTIQEKVANRYEVDSYPTLIFFNKGKDKKYDGNFDEKSLTIWMRQNATPNLKKLTTENEIEEMKKKELVSAIYFGSNPKEKAEFLLAERKIVDIALGIVEDESLINKYTKPGTLVLFKNFDELRNDLDLSKSDSKEIENFMRIYSNPRVSVFNTLTAPVIFARRNKALIFLVHKNTPKWDELNKMALNVANKLLGKILVFISDIEDGMQIKLAELFGIRSNDLPTVRIVDPKFSFPKKYKMEEKLNEDNVVKFFEEWSKGKVKDYLRSEKEPKENNGDVKIVVSNTFKKEVINNDNDVIIFFFAPWCGHCQKFYPKYEDLAHKLRKNNKKLMFAKMDATENDIPDYPIRNFPTIKFYPGNKKNQEPIHINNRKSIEEVFDTIKTNAFNKLVLDGVNIKKITDL